MASVKDLHSLPGVVANPDPATKDFIFQQVNLYGTQQLSPRCRIESAPHSLKLATAAALPYLLLCIPSAIAACTSRQLPVMFDTVHI